jgi:N-acetylmuramoyl-L-alanine amidase
MKRVLVALVIGMSILAFCAVSESASGPDKLCIVIDAGHGGRETGSVGPKGLKEKDVVLDVAKKLRDLLQNRLNARVVLTRRGEYHLALEDRANLANTAKEGDPADLLISIHADACLGASVNGFKVFYASKRHEFDLDEYIQMEGTTVDEDDFRARQRDFVESARWDDLYRRHSYANSLLASSIGAAMENRLRIPKMLVAPAVLRLLRGLDMPAVLVETGFLSNTAGETLLGTEEFKETCSLALLEGVTAYLDQTRDPFGRVAGTRAPAAARPGAPTTDRRID